MCLILGANKCSTEGHLFIFIIWGEGAVAWRVALLHAKEGTSIKGNLIIAMWHQQMLFLQLLAMSKAI